MSGRSRILIVVFDGLRPDLITPERMPALADFVKSGCLFANSRCVFPSSTRVNSAALGAGSYPDRTGLISNKYFDPTVFTDRIIHTGNLAHIEKAETAYSGGLIAGRTLGDVLAANGLDFVVLGSGSAGTTRLVNPHAKVNRQVSLCMRDWTSSTPDDFAASILDRFGPIAEIGFPSTARMEQQTTMFIEGVFPARKPDVSLLWFNEPDWTQHFKGLGSQETDAGLATLDQQFQRLLDWAQSAEADGPVDFIVLSDHGHITASSKIDLKREFDLVGFEFRPEAKERRAFVAHLGNIGAVWLDKGSNSLAADFVAWLNDQDWCGLVFSGNGDGVMGAVPGTFDRALLNNGHERSPDLFFTLRSNAAENSAGIAGSGFAAAEEIPLGGSFHGGPSRTEMNNLLVFGGTQFHQSVVHEFPAGIVDVAPTVLAMFGIEQPKEMSGRILHEALSGGKTPSENPRVREFRDGSGTREKVVRTADFEGITYFLDGGINE